MLTSLSFIISQSLLKVMSIELILPSHPLFPPVLLSSIFCSIRVFSNELALHIRWPNIGATIGAVSHTSSIFLHSAMTLTIFVTCVLVPQACPTLCNPGDCSPPGSSVLEIPQARILEWVAIYFSRASPDPGIEPRSALQADFLLSEPPGDRKFLSHRYYLYFCLQLL